MQNSKFIDTLDPRKASLKNDVAPPPPHLFSANNPDGIKLERFNAIDRAFRSIPMFTGVSPKEGASNLTIRDFLRALTCKVTNTGMRLSEDEFRHVIMSKLSPSLVNLVEDIGDIKQLYCRLTAYFDTSPTNLSAFSQLMNLAPTKPDFQDFIRECILLGQLIDDSGSRNLATIVAIRSVLPDRIREKLDTFVNQFNNNESGSTKNYPDSADVLLLLRQYVTDINSHLQKLVSKPKLRNVSEVQASCSICGKDNHTAENCFKTKHCTTCNKKGHDEANCWGDKTCNKCLRKGHVADSCRVSNCRLCHNPSHGIGNCNKYNKKDLSDKYCSFCYNKYYVKNFHLGSACLNQKN